MQKSENNDGLGSKKEDTKKANSGKNRDTNNENTVNINTATQTELETIPGVGPSTALKIIDYRKENGNYKKIEDVQNVKGIGEAKYKEMKDYIRVK